MTTSQGQPRVFCQTYNFNEMVWRIKLEVLHHAEFMRKTYVIFCRFLLSRAGSFFMSCAPRWSRTAWQRCLLRLCRGILFNPLTRILVAIAKQIEPILLYNSWLGCVPNGLRRDLPQWLGPRLNDNKCKNRAPITPFFVFQKKRHEQESNVRGAFARINWIDWLKEINR